MKNVIKVTRCFVRLIRSDVDRFSVKRSRGENEKGNTT